MSRDHRNLRAFELADAFVFTVYRTTADFPREELFGLTSQIRRAAISAPSNIVEGCARPSQKDFVHFLNMALGSLREAGYQLDLGQRLGYGRAGAHAEAKQSYERTANTLGALIRSLTNDT